MGLLFWDEAGTLLTLCLLHYGVHYPEERGEDDDGQDQGDHTDGRGEPDLRAHKALLVRQVLQVHRACPRAAGRADVDLAEDLEYEDGSEQDDHPEVGQQMRQLDVPEHHEAVAAVEPGRLPLLLRNGLQPGQQHEHEERLPLPGDHRGDHDQGLLRHRVEPVEADEADHPGDDAEVGAEKLILPDQTRNDRHYEERGHEQGLDQTLGEEVPVQQQRQPEPDQVPVEEAQVDGEHEGYLRDDRHDYQRGIQQHAPLTPG